MNLDECRQQIDDVDRQIMELLGRRCEIAAEIGKIKSRAGLPVLDWERESEVIRRASSRCGGVLQPDAAGRIYRRILRESRQIQFDVAGESEYAGV